MLCASSIWRRLTLAYCSSLFSLFLFLTLYGFSLPVFQRGGRRFHQTATTSITSLWTTINLPTAKRPPVFYCLLCACHLFCGGSLIGCRIFGWSWQCSSKALVLPYGYGACGAKLTQGLCCHDGQLSVTLSRFLL